MNITEFTVVRHGETDANLNGILQGQNDTLLNELGIRQAQCAADRLAAEPIDHIFSSDLSRAMKTAELIAAPHRLTVQPLGALREWHLGELQGGKWEELKKKYPEVMAAFDNENGDIPVPGGESRFDFQQRIAGCLEELAACFENRKILLVTHGGVLKAMFRHIVGNISPTCRLPLTSNASVGKFRYIGGFWQLMSWNDVLHLRHVDKSESVVF